MKKVAAYCRVSTDKTDQANSFLSQQKYFKEYIDRNPDWILHQIFADEGLSGTSTKKRTAFHAMIAAAKNGTIDLIVTKEVSRFARNTLDTLQYTRELKRYGVGVIFMNDNINTLDPDAELRLSIMASIAQEESRKTSERVKWGQKRRMEQGVVFGRDMLGYDVRDGKLIVNEEGATIVRLIFHKFLNEKKGCHCIARELREQGIKTATHMKSWSNTVILRVLRNEKYVGDLVQKKTYTPNYLTHEKKYNRGHEEKVVLKDHHQPIVSREIWDKTQEELTRRAPSEEVKARYSNRYVFSGKIKCGYCGATFVLRKKKKPNGTIYKMWQCVKAANHGRKRIDCHGDEVGCDGRMLSDDDLMFLMQNIVKNLSFDGEYIYENLMRIVKCVLHEDQPNADEREFERGLSKLKEKKQSLLALFLSKDISKSDYRDMYEKLEGEINSIKQKQTEQNRQKQLQNDNRWLEKISKSIQALLLGKQDENFYRNILERIIVHDRQTIDVNLSLLPLTFPCELKKCKYGTSVPISVSSPRNSG